MLSLLIGLYTVHLTPEEYHNDNQMLVAKYDHYLAGTMVNSYGRRSILAGYEAPIGRNWGLIIGGATGYDYDCMLARCSSQERDDDDVIPIFAPYYTYKSVSAVVQGNAFTLIWEIPTW